MGFVLSLETLPRVVRRGLLSWTTHLFIFRGHSNCCEGFGGTGCSNQAGERGNVEGAAVRVPQRRVDLGIMTKHKW